VGGFRPDALVADRVRLKPEMALFLATRHGRISGRVAAITCGPVSAEPTQPRSGAFRQATMFAA